VNSDVDGNDDQITSVAALGDPQRRALYRYVVAQPEPVSRDQVAEGLGVARHVVKFHLDKLEAEGLLEVEYRRPPGRSGPGAGRPAKLYRRAAQDFAVNLPGRRYDLAARVLAKAITNASETGAPLPDALVEAARETGHALGQEARQSLGRRRSSAAAVKTITRVLEANGYEPRKDRGCITLANCPFHALSRDYTDLVCGMNLDLITGLVESVDANALKTRLTPSANQCCVSLTTSRR
jgi:predicted ArsR family transcriptional regulator